MKGPDLAPALAASIRYVQEHKRQVDDIENWLDAVPPPRAKKLQRKKRMTDAAAAIVVHRDVSGPLEFTPEQRAMIRETFANGASEKEFQVLLEVAKVRRLNPLLRQVHFVKRRDKRRNVDVWSVQVSIDGLRAIAERTGKYDGQDEPEYERDKDGYILSCKVKVYRKDWSRPAIGIAHWSEYVQEYDGKPTKFWADMPHVMIAKCAEAIAMRKAFPEDMGGLYVEEEMQQADNVRELHSGQRLEHSPAELPGDSSEAKDNELFESVMATLVSLEETLQKANPVTYELLLSIRAMMGARDRPPTSMTKAMSELNLGSDISPGQKKDLGKLWNRIDRQVKRYEGLVQAPGPEQSFEDEGEEPEPGPTGGMTDE